MPTCGTGGWAAGPGRASRRAHAGARASGRRARRAARGRRSRSSRNRGTTSASPARAGGPRCGQSAPGASLPCQPPLLDIEEPDLLGVTLDEDLARLDAVTHEIGKEPLGGRRILDRHALQRARLRVHGGHPELLGVHLAETLEALEPDALLGEIECHL